MKILVLGDVILDIYTQCECAKISPEAPVPVLRPLKSERKLGGAANVAACLAALGVQTHIASVVGDDEAANSLESELKNQQIKPILLREKDRLTSKKERLLAMSNQIARIDNESTHACSKQTTKELIKLLDAQYDAVIISDYAKGVINRTLVKAALERSELVLADPKNDLEILRGCDIITPNLKEARQFAGNIDANDLASLLKALEFLRDEYDIACPIITLSERGIATLAPSGETGGVPGFKAANDEKADSRISFFNRCSRTPLSVECKSEQPNAQNMNAKQPFAQQLRDDFAPNERASGVDRTCSSSSHELASLAQKHSQMQANGDLLIVPTKASEVYDVTGAGDSVIAALAYALASKMDMKNALEFANEAAAITVSKIGTYAPKLAQITHSKNKIVSLKTACELAAGKKLVWTNGCFDVLHAGHVSYLAKARKLGDMLIVGLNSDSSVRSLKGPSRPINSEQDRAAVLAALASVDLVVIFDELTPLECIKALRPSVLVKGADYKIDEVIGAEFASKVELIEFLPGRSSSNIINKCKES